MATKKHNGTWFEDDPNFDYSTEIQKAVDSGDLQKAAYLEKSRNAKINYYGMPYDYTYQYEDYLPSVGNNAQNNNGKSAVPSSKESYSDISKRLLGEANGMNFTYDANKDPLYNQIKKNYQNTVDDVIEDTMGTYAGMTGGVPSSYATSAAAQAGARHLQKADDMIPELYQLAYSKFADDKADLYKQFGIMQGLEEQEYNRQQNERNWEYQLGRDKVADERYAAEWGYQTGRDAVSDEWTQKQWDYTVSEDERKIAGDNVMSSLAIGTVPSQEDLDASGLFKGMTPEEVLSAYKSANAPAVSYGGGSQSYIDASEMQDYYGILNFYSNGENNDGDGEKLMTSFVIDKLKPYFTGSKTLDSNSPLAEAKKLILDNTENYNIDVDDARLVLESMGFPHVEEDGVDIYYSWLDDYEDRTGDDKYKGMKKKDS